MRFILSLEKYLFLFLKVQDLEKSRLKKKLILKNFTYLEEIKNNFSLILFLKINCGFSIPLRIA